MKVAKRLDLKNSHHKHVLIQIQLCEVIDVLTKFIVKILPYVCVLNHYIVHLKFKKCYISIKLGEKEKNVVHTHNGILFNHKNKEILLLLIT